MAAMRAPQYQIVAVRGLFDTDEQFQVSDWILIIFHIHFSHFTSISFYLILIRFLISI